MGCKRPGPTPLFAAWPCALEQRRAPVVTIFYCVTCNYLPQANAAVEALREALGVEAALIRGHSGRFEVEVDGQVILTKGSRGFPTSRDVVEAVARALGRLQAISH